MASIQHSFNFDTNSQIELNNLRIEVVFPKYSFRSNDQEIQRFVDKHHYFSISHNPEEENYRVHMPLQRLVGSDIQDIFGFFLYHFIEIINPRLNINDFGIPFTVYVKDTNGQEIMSETFEGIFYHKKSFSSDYDPRNYDVERGDFFQTYGPLGELNSSGLEMLPRDRDRQVFLINKATFELLHYYLSAGRENGGITHRAVLELIEILTDLSEGYPKAVAAENMITVTQFVDFMSEREIPVSRELYDGLLDIVERLFDFPLAIPEIQTVSVNGTMAVESEGALTMENLDFYDLSIEYAQKNNTPKILRYNWNNSSNEPSDNSIDFAFAENQAIIANNISGQITVKVKGHNGVVLWENQYGPMDEELQSLEISIKEYPGGSIVLGSDSGIPTGMKRLRGKVLQSGNKYSLDELTIVVQAKMEGDELFRIVSATQTDKSGNFSMDYPYGDYIEAQALVSLMPNSPVDLTINTDQSNESISDDFIFLLLTDAEVVDQETETEGHDKDDCGCHKPNKAKRLPDQEDLISSGEYTQDIGGSCLNLSTPNRTLREYSYNAIIRTSDPDVANYILQKNESDGKIQYELVGGNEKLKRGEVDLDNPIRWEDSPDAKENLSLYQAVTVATGHILHFKSVFKADGYSLGDLVYSLPLAPGQKKQIVVFESSHSLQGAESQTLTQGESLSAELISDRSITDQLGGGINEALSGKSKAHTSGMSAGLGAAASYGGIGGSLGVAGGFANSNSSASQNSSRNISQFFGEKLRQSLTQNAESYRQLNASVVTTVTEGQDYGVTSEVIANHNHCHSLTMMYFEVLRHYAIYQEVSHVEECVFVPLLLTHFSTENIHKWKDVLAPNLLPIPSNTYLKWQHFGIRRFNRLHPLLKAFDANERIKTDYSRVEFPAVGSTYADGHINKISGEFTLRIDLKRPKSKYDRIKSLPIITQTLTSQEVDPFATAKKGIGDSILGAFTGGLSLLATGAPGTDIQYKTTEEEILVKAQIFDEFMSLDANYQLVPPAKCIRIKTFKPRPINLLMFGFRLTGTYSGEEFFEEGILDKQQWTTFARILDYSDVYNFLEYYFAGRLIAEWDEIFKQDILPEVYSKIIDSIRIEEFSWDLTSIGRYTGGHRRMKIRLRGDTVKKRIDLPNNLQITCNDIDIRSLQGGYTTLIIENIKISYSTDHFEGRLFQGYVGDDLLDGTTIDIPLNSRDKINPRKEDDYLVNTLIEHLNSNIEHYNKILWSNLDPDRRFMLLDGFNIQTFTSSGHREVKRSLASVVKNELITITGNSLVFPVADGFRIGRNSMLEEIGDGVFQETSLLDFYKPLTPMSPYRLSVPTRGVFMEAIQGNCDACEMVKENSSQDWDKFRTEDPTPISPVITPTPTITNYTPQYKDFAQPLVNIQNAPDAPAPAAGLAQLSELLGKSDVFKDITGLAGNQDNVMRTYLSNQENAKAFAEMAKSLATQQHNTQNTDSIAGGIDRARQDGTLSDQDAQDLTRQHLQQQIDGGESAREDSQFDREQNRPSLSEVAADAVNRGQTVQAARTDADGTHESIDVRGDGSESNEPVTHEIEAIQQPSSMSCWATVATMMTNWKNSRSEQIQDVLRFAGNNLEPANEDYYVDMFTSDHGLPATEKGQFINALGMVGEPPASFAKNQYVSWLRNHGPLWITTDDDSSEAFSPHARVLFEIRNPEDSDPNNVLFSFIDPADATVVTETFQEFIEYFEQMARDSDSGNPLFIQVVRFQDTINRDSAPGEGVSHQRIRIKNRFNPTDNQLNQMEDYTVSIINATNSQDFALSGNGYNNMNLSSLPDGDYGLIITPDLSVVGSIDWPSLGNPSGSATAPSRIWQELRSGIRIENHRIIRADNVNVTISGRRFDVKMRAVWHKSPNRSSRPSGQNPESITIHHTAGRRPLPPFFLKDRAQQIASGTSPSDVRTVSAHYVLPRDGFITKLVHETEIANHAGTSWWQGRDHVNDFTVGIEIVHHPSDGAYTNIQYQMLTSLLQQIVNEFPSIMRYSIHGHNDIGIQRSGIQRLGRKSGDPGLEFNWPYLESHGLGIIPSTETATFSVPIDATRIYGDLFHADQSISLPIPASRRPSNYSNIVLEINSDLDRIGYFTATFRTHFDTATQQAIHMFKEHFFTGSRRQASSLYNGRFDFETAKMLKRVIHFLDNV